MTRVLIAGCGYVGSTLALALSALGHEVYALKRGPAQIEGVEPIVADLTKPLPNLPEVDVAVFTAAPDASSESAYRAIYVDGSRHVRDALAPGARFVFTSSTAVYGENDGGEVNESSPTTPASFRGRVLLEAEANADVVLRLAGIYGPGRARSLDKVRRGEARFSPGRYLNLIHRDDAAGALEHLMMLERPERVFVGVDEEPVESEAFYRWLAEQIGASPPTADPSPRGKNKRCSSARLVASGYQLRFPTFREGFRALLSPRVLAPCRSSPHCVSSRATEAGQRMSALRFTGSAADARQAIEDAVRHLGGRVVETDPVYVRAEFTSRLFGFVDDVEWVIDADTRRIDFRSASRVGYSDLGVNRRRMNKIIGHLERGKKISRASDED